MHAAQALLRSLPHRPETPAPAPVEVVGLGAHLTGREENLSVRESLIITPLLQNRDSGYESGASCLTCSFPPASGDPWRVSLLVSLVITLHFHPAFHASHAPGRDNGATQAMC